MAASNPLNPVTPHETISARRTESIDAAGIIKLATPETELLFGRKNVVNVIEKAVLAVSLHNENDEILGHGAFYDYPNSTYINPGEWEEWYHENYEEFGDGVNLTALNTLFIHYFVTKKGYQVGCGKEIIRTVFNAIPDLHFIIIVVPFGAFPDAALSELFKPMKRNQDHSDVTTSLFMCKRHGHVPELYIRNAKVEDHDDVTPIFNRQSDVLDKTYGRYFLAELIEAQDEHMQCLIGEYDGTAIGFLSLSDDVNTQLLNECFELRPFHGLCVPDDNDVLVRPTQDYDPISHPEAPLPMDHTKSVSSFVAHVESATKSAVSESADVPEIVSEASKEGAASPKDAAATPKDSTATPKETTTPKLSESYMASAEPLDSPAQSTPSSAGSEKTVTPHVVESGPQVSYSVTKVEMPRLATRYESHPPPRFVPTYAGACNAFAIQLFCIDEKFEMRSCDFMKKAFSLFPDREYCIVTIPHLVPVFPLLQSFVRVTPRCPSTLSQELFIFHKSGLLKDIDVRLACTTDTEDVEKLVKSLQLGKSILDSLEVYNKLRRDETGVPMQAVVATSSQQIIGICVIQQENDIEYIRSHYNIEDFIYFNHHLREEHGHIYHFALSPSFNHFTKHFLREVMRICNKSSLYYPVYPDYMESKYKSHSLVTCLNEMVPVHPRRQIHYPVQELGINAPSERVLKKMETFALNHINRKLTMEPKVTINARIVVVGASDVGIAFLQTLAYCPHLRFNNLTLVSPHGLPGEMEPDLLQNSMLAESFCFERSTYAKIGLKIWINSVYGMMTAIDRAKKLVIVNEKTVVPYDHLILCTGQQYKIPAPSNVSTGGPVSEKDLPDVNQPYKGSKPENLFLINDEFDAALVLFWIEKNILANGEKVIIYGNTIDTYCTIHTLLKLGVVGSNIILVKPPTSSEVTCFNNSVVEECVRAALEEAGVVVYKDYVFSYWAGVHQDSLKITKLTFISVNTSPIQLDCGIFLTFAAYGVDDSAFKAVNDACLVYDGKLVIDAAFHTNDVAIRAAGPMTKYKRKYHVGDWAHDVFNSKEVGIALASAMLRLFDPTLEPITEPPKELLNLIPIYRNAKIQACTLPGGYEYLHIQKPNLPVDLEKQKLEYNFGSEIVTGDPKLNNNGYLRLHFNQYDSIETITCLSKLPYSKSNIVCLFGIHKRYLNNISVRYYDGLIPDLYKFFEESWSMALFHDRFDDFCEEVRELLMTRSEETVESVDEQLRQIVDDEVPLSANQSEAMEKIFEGTGTKRAVEVRLLNYLGYNYYHLPMYAKPGLV